MRHGISGRKLGRNTASRKSLFRNLAKSLIEHEQIITTTPKAKELRPFVEKLITLGKKGNLFQKRQAFAELQDNEIVNKLFSILAERYKTRNGGYTRIIKAGFRYGDNAERSVIELVDRDESAKGKKDLEYVASLKEASNA
ncbi:50S ribosomal protein L17 [Rickettsiales bacterium LUAb2]